MPENEAPLAATPPPQSPEMRRETPEARRAALESAHRQERLRIAGGASFARLSAMPRQAPTCLTYATLRTLNQQSTARIVENITTEPIQRHLDAAEHIFSLIDRTDIEPLVMAREQELSRITSRLRAPGKSFDVLSTTAMITEEQRRVNEWLTRTPPNAGLKEALAAEIRYLNVLLEALKVPQDPRINPFAGYPEKPQTEAAKRLQQDLRTLGRIPVMVLAGGLALLSTLIAFKQNRANPNLTATALWMIPTLLAARGKKLFETKEDRLLQQTAIVTLPEFTAVAHREDFLMQSEEWANAVEAMLAGKTRIRSIIEKKGLTPEDQQELLEILGVTPDSPMAVHILKLHSEGKLTPFIRVITQNARSQDAQQFVLHYIRSKARPPSVQIPPAPQVETR